MTSIRYHIFLGLYFGLSMLVFFALMNFGFYIIDGGRQTLGFTIWLTLKAGVASGILFGVSMYFIANSRLFKRQAHLDNPDAQPMILAADANFFVTRVISDGMLYLFADKLIFKPHKIDFRTQQITIELRDIKNVDLCNLLVVIPYGLAITTFDGKKAKFVVEERQRWKEEIEKLLTSRLLVN